MGQLMLSASGKQSIPEGVWIAVELTLPSQFTDVAMHVAANWGISEQEPQCLGHLLSSRENFLD